MDEFSKSEPLPPLVDAHAHLDFVDFAADRFEMLERAWLAGVMSIVNVGTEPGDWASVIRTSREYRGVFVALGIHPNSAGRTTDEVLATLEGLCRDPENRVVALGETGLDYYRQHVDHETQQASLKAHLALARQLDMPVVIHLRDAHDDLLATLEREGKGTRGAMHSFGGDVEYAHACMKLGYYISLSGPVTFKNAADKHRLAREIPLERLLVETDCPFLTPEPFRGRRNEPAHVQYTVRAIAELKDRTYEEVAAATSLNAIELFGLPAGESLGARSRD